MTDRPYRPKPVEEVRRNMQAIRSKENATERALRSLLHRMGYRYRKYAKLPGRPDIVFPAARVAVFVDGDYWHGRVLVEQGHGALERRIRTSNRAYWLTKLAATVERDARNTATLAASGWLVLRFWESEAKRDLERTARRIARTVDRRLRAR